MASASITRKKPCSKCDKGGGIFTCDGCHQSFCRKHSDEHRQELAIQMDTIGQEHDVLQRDLDKDMTEHPLLVRIDEWERDSIEKIQQVARQARVDLEQALNEKKQKLKETMNKLTNELQNCRESEDYTELELDKWVEELNGLRQSLEQSLNVCTTEDEKQRSFTRFIKLRNLPASCSILQSILTTNLHSCVDTHSIESTNEIFNDVDEGIRITEHGKVATLSRWTLRRSAIAFGQNIYSRGVHQLRFLIEKKINEYFFFGIVTSSQTDTSTILRKNTGVYGWWPAEHTIEWGIPQKNSPHVDILVGDEVKMILDCDQMQMHFEHQRTKQVFNIFIDIEKCPFPWKLVIGLYGNGSSVRIIQ